MPKPLAALTILLAILTAPVLAGDATATPLTKEAALEILVQGDQNETERIGEADYDRLLAEFKAAHAAGDDGKWAAGIALVLMDREQNEDAYDWAKKAVELGPDLAVTHYALGSTAGVMANEASIFSKGAYAKKCRTAFERAVEIDPEHFPSRTGLVMFYTFAPGIAGGSWAKAYENAEAIAKIEGHEKDGWQLKSMVAAQKGDWAVYDDAMSNALAYMESDHGTDTLRAQHAYTVLLQKKDPEGALKALEAVENEQVKGEVLYTYVTARALQELERYAEAIPWYEKTIETQPETKNSRYRLGVCALEAGRYDIARDAFQGYLDLYPKGEDASAAKKGLKQAEKGLR